MTVSKDRTSPLQIQISLVDLFAATAPAVPDWFQHDGPERPAYPKALIDLETSPQSNTFQMQWRLRKQGDRRDRHPALTEGENRLLDVAGSEYHKHQRALDLWLGADGFARLLQWRREYAMRMAAFLEPDGGQHAELKLMCPVTRSDPNAQPGSIEGEDLDGPASAAAAKAADALRDAVTCDVAESTLGVTGADDPLVKLGPGGDYTREMRAHGCRAIPYAAQQIRCGEHLDLIT